MQSTFTGPNQDHTSPITGSFSTTPTRFSDKKPLLWPWGYATLCTLQLIIPSIMCMYQPRDTTSNDPCLGLAWQPAHVRRRWSVSIIPRTLGRAQCSRRPSFDIAFLN